VILITSLNMQEYRGCKLEEIALQETNFFINISYQF